MSKTFHRRDLKPPCVALSSAEGRTLFKEAIVDGKSDIYLPLADVMNTQSHPAYCGVASLAVVLNCLLIDPKRTWKGVWRWWSDEMLDCCTPLEKIKMKGMTLGKLNCLAKCQGAKSELTHGDAISIEEFRKIITGSCASLDSSQMKIIIVNYSRPALNQTGSGHFSPIGAFHTEKDMVLVLDVARFKHPAHWVPLAVLHAAMAAADPESGKPRGFLVVSSSADLDRRCACGSEEEGTLEEESDAKEALIASMKACAHFVGELKCDSC